MVVQSKLPIFKVDTEKENGKMEEQWTLHNVIREDNKRGKIALCLILYDTLWLDGVFKKKMNIKGKKRVLKLNDIQL